MIRFEQVCRRFGRTVAVDGVSLDIPAGDSVALWGDNGAGKTTLLRCALGLLRFSGRITLGGHDVWRHGKRARMLVGYVPQELGFYDELRVSEAIRFFATLKGVAASPAEVLHQVGLTGSEGKRIRELSGGMKQRLALGIALLGDPPVLILDEVTASLDACGREELVGLLRGLSGSGRTMLFASHRVEEVSALARRVVVMEAGKTRTICDAQAFAARRADDGVLHLSLPVELRDRAIAILSAGGLAVRRNGVGVLVRLPPERRAEPFRLLESAGVSVSDFRLLRTDATWSVERQEAHP